MLDKVSEDELNRVSMDERNGVSMDKLDRVYLNDLNRASLDELNRVFIDEWIGGFKGELDGLCRRIESSIYTQAKSLKTSWIDSLRNWIECI